MLQGPWMKFSGVPLPPRQLAGTADGTLLQHIHNHKMPNPICCLLCLPAHRVRQHSTPLPWSQAAVKKTQRAFYSTACCRLGFPSTSPPSTHSSTCPRPTPKPYVRRECSRCSWHTVQTSTLNEALFWRPTATTAAAASPEAQHRHTARVGYCPHAAPWPAQCCCCTHALPRPPVARGSCCRDAELPGKDALPTAAAAV